MMLSFLQSKRSFASYSLGLQYIQVYLFSLDISLQNKNYKIKIMIKIIMTVDIILQDDKITTRLPLIHILELKL